MKIRIYYEDTDAGGIVYHSNYFKYCERSRSEEFLKNGIDLFKNNCGYVVRKIINANFIKPARLADMIDVTISIKELKKASLLVHHDIFVKDEKIFDTDMMVAYVCDGKVVKIPQKSRDFLSTYLVKSVS